MKALERRERGDETHAEIGPQLQRERMDDFAATLLNANAVAFE